MPHIVEEIKYEDGLSKKMSYPVLRAKITKETSEEITRMLVGLWITDSKRGLNILALLPKLAPRRLRQRERRILCRQTYAFIYGLLSGI